MNCCPTQESIMADRLEAILASHRCPQRVTFVREDDGGGVFSVCRAARVLALPVVKHELCITFGAVEIGEELFGVQQIAVMKNGDEK